MSFIFYADLLDGRGLQVLYDSKHPTDNAVILSPKAKLELNKAYTAEFSLLPNHYLYSSIKKMTTLIYIVQHDRLLFRGRIIDIIPDFYRQKKVTCESDIAFLLDSILPKNMNQNIQSISGKIERILKMVDGYEYDSHHEYVPISAYDPVDAYKHFDVGNITVTTDQLFPFQEDSKMQVAKDYLFNELLPYYGGILQTRTEDFGTADEAHYIDYLKDPLQDDSDPISQNIRFGVNLLNFTEQNPVSSIYTRLIPTGQDGRTIENVLGGKIYISNPELEAIYGIIYRVENWSDIAVSRNLLDAATKYNNEHAKVFPNDLSVKAIDLKILDGSQEEIKIGDKVLAFSKPHQIDRVMCCKAIDYDFMNPENNTYSIGTYVSSIDFKKATHGAKKFNYSGSSTEEESLTEQTVRNEKTNLYHSSRVDTIDDGLFNTAGSNFSVETIEDGQGNTYNVLVAGGSSYGRSREDSD